MAEPAFDAVAMLARLGRAPRRITSDSRQVGAGDAGKHAVERFQ